MCLQGSTPTEMKMDQCCDYDAMQPPHESSDGSCIPQCDVYFSYCQGRPLGTAINSTNCPNNNFFQSTMPITNANETRISFGDRVFGTLNPVTFNGTQISWVGATVAYLTLFIAIIINAGRYSVLHGVQG